jgi:tRNA-(ms[2]io[6]A)-hydroxylase
VSLDVDLTHINQFLGCETPQAWVQAALEDQETMLIDHANCEKKAAKTALNLMFKYIDRDELLQKMSRLAREELRHFEQVTAIMKRRKISYRQVSASRYAAGLMEHVRTSEPDRLVDILIIGAFIECRSCERFAKIAPSLDAELQKFYISLLKSESRHFTDYLSLAEKAAGVSIEDRIAFFREQEKELILSGDSVFRFHSGIPA